MYNAQFYVLKENVAKFIEAVKPQATFNVEDMGEYYSIFFNCGVDVENAQAALDTLCTDQKQEFFTLVRNAQAAVEEIEAFIEEYPQFKEYMLSGSLEEYKTDYPLIYGVLRYLEDCYK